MRLARVSDRPCASGSALLAGAAPSPLQAYLLAAQGWMLMLLERFREAGQVAEQAAGLAREAGADAVETGALTTLGVSTVMTGDADAGLALLHASCRMAVAGSGLEDLQRLLDDGGRSGRRWSRVVPGPGCRTAGRRAGAGELSPPAPPPRGP